MPYDAIIMSTQTQQKAQQDGVKPRAQASLLEALSAVSAAVEAMPETGTARRSRSLSDAFMRGDAVLTTIHKSMLDARANLAALVAKYGMADAMVETLTYQLCQLEAAYAQRLALLRKRREEGSRAHKPIQVGEETPANVRSRPYGSYKRDDTMWLLVAMMLMNAGMTPPARSTGHVLSAA